MREMFVTGAGGVKLRCAEYGDNDASVVVLLHALGPSGDDWALVAEEMGAEHRVLALDQRGHGKSDRPDEYSFELMRDDVVALLDQLDIAITAVVGHSMGGSVAFLLTERHPQRVTRLVIEDTPPPRIGLEFPELSEEPPGNVPFDWQMARAIVGQLNHPDPAWWDDLAGIRCPTLIVGGGSTSHVPQHMLGEVAQLIGDSRYVTFEGAGHNVHATMREEFMRVVQPFLRGEEIPNA